jgi:hypothetical protein
MEKHVKALEAKLSFFQIRQFTKMVGASNTVLWLKITMGSLEMEKSMGTDCKFLERTFMKDFFRMVLRLAEGRIHSKMGISTKESLKIA